MTILSDLKSLDDEIAMTVWMQMFNSMFVARSRDIVTDIRLLSVVVHWLMVRFLSFNWRSWQHRISFFPNCVPRECASIFLLF